MDSKSSNINQIELFLNQKENTKIQGLFEDNLFPANEVSLNSFRTQLKITEKKDETRKVIWKRLSEVLKPNQYNVFRFDDKPNAKNDQNDIEAPNCGNQEFLSILGLFAQKQKILKETILNKTQINKNGYFDINLFVDGVPAALIIDDFFPIYESQNVDNIEFYGFGIPKSSNIWSMLLAKIFVKFNFYLNKNSAADFMSTMEFFTSYPLNLINNLNENKNELDISIRNALEHGRAVHAKINEDEKTKKFLILIGLMPNAVYTILNIQTLKLNNANGVYHETEEVTLIKLQNNFNQSNWSGDWSLNSPLWTQYLKDQLDTLTKTENFKTGMNNISSDNTFWIGLDDFTKFFNYTVISMLSNDLVELSFRIPYNSIVTYNFVELKLKTRQDVYFVVNQMNPNFIEASDLKNYDFLNIFLLKKDSDAQTYTIVRNKFSNLGRINFSANENNSNILENGEYLIAYHYPIQFANQVKKLNFSYNEEELKEIPELNRDIILGVYSKNPSQISIEPINQSNFARFISSNPNYQIAVFSAIENFVKENTTLPYTKQNLINYAELDEKLSRKYTLINDDNFGFGYIFYKNDSEGYLNEKLIFNSLENVNSFVHFQDGTTRGVFTSRMIDDNLHSTAPSEVRKIERHLPYLTEQSNFSLKKTPAGKGNSAKYEIDLKISPQSRALIFFEKINENLKISYESRSAFTYPPLALYRAPEKKSKFTQSLSVSNLKYEGRDVDIVQSILDYGTGVQYLYKNTTKNKAATITLKFKNSRNLQRLAESSKVFKIIEDEESDENIEDNKHDIISHTLYTDEEKNNVEEIVITCKPNGIAFVQLEAKNPYEGFSYEAEVEYLVRYSYLHKLALFKF